MNLKTVRIIFAVLCFSMLTLLFVDFTGTAAQWFGWLARIQLLPAVLSLNAAVVLSLIVLTLILGRVYCSVICPLGVMQDCFGWFGKIIRKNRYGYSKSLTLLRIIVLSLFVLSIIFGIGTFVALLAPYSAYGRIVQSLLSPLWQFGNNILADWDAEAGGYSYYSVDIWLRSPWTLCVAIITFVILGVLAWRNGRTYCNTVCPVGTVLGYLARFSLFRPVIDKSKCNSCGLCARNCKASCIDSKAHVIDYSRCVACMDCIDKCHKGAISYSATRLQSDRVVSKKDEADHSRRSFFSVTAGLLASSFAVAKEKTVDGGLAAITDKKIPQRSTPVVPPGAKGISNLTHHCTACQLCVAVCPNGVLRPSSRAENLLQPESSFERGYCRPECTKCSEVCPTGAICRIDRAEKSSIQVGHAVWIKENCVPLTDGVECGNCARHCPAGAIQMISSDKDDVFSPKVPCVDTERCIGCGACENLCPSRPFSAIYVEGHERHRII